MGALQGKFIFNLPHDPKGFVAVVDADYTGATHSAQLKVAQNIHGVAGAHAGCSYMQAITPRWSVGGEGACAVAGPSSSLTVASKYSAPKWTGVAALTRSGAALADQLALSYARVVSPNRVTLGTELVLQAAGEATMAAGAEFNLKQSRVNLSVDGNGKMASVVETQLSPAAKLTFSADMQLSLNEAEPGKARDHFKFGYALQIGQ